MATLEMTRARTAVFEITVTQESGPVDLAGKALAFQAKERLSGGAVIDKSSGFGITASSPASAGIAVLQIDPNDTETLADIQSNTLVWDLKLTDGANDYGIASGTLKIFGNVGP